MSKNPSTAAPSQVATSPIPEFASPDVFELSGGDINVRLLPTGAGSMQHLTYRDSQRTLNFSGDQIRKVEVLDLGTIVSVTIVQTVDSGSTTFSLLIPA